MMLKEFFIDEVITIPFKLFGKTHIFLMAFVVFCCLIIYLNREKIYNLNLNLKNNLTKIVAFILLSNMLILYLSQFLYHNFDYKTMLPFHLCYIANYFYVYVILFRKNNLYKYIYFLSFLGPIPAIIFFDVPSIWESFNFYLYLISHHFLVIASFFTFYMYPKKINKKDISKLIIILNFLYLVMSIFNYYFNINYFFSDGIPPFITELLPFLKYFPTTLVLEIMELIIIILIYKFINSEYEKIKLKSKE